MLQKNLLEGEQEEGSSPQRSCPIPGSAQGKDGAGAVQGVKPSKPCGSWGRAVAVSCPSGPALDVVLEAFLALSSTVFFQSQPGSCCSVLFPSRPNRRGQVRCASKHCNHILNGNEMCELNVNYSRMEGQSLLVKV